MNLYFDLDTGVFCSAPGSRDTVSALSFKRGDTVRVNLRFVSGITVQELAAGASGQIGIKAAGDYDGDFIAAAPSWTKAGTGASAVYSFDLDLNTEPINTLLGYGAGADVASVQGMFELQYVVDEVTTSSNTVTATIHNDVVRGTEGTPAAVSSGFRVEESAPIDGAAASVTINPAGSDNSVTYTAVTSGTAGNSITVAYASPSLVTGATLVVAVAGSAITVTPRKRTMIVSGITNPAAANGNYDYVSSIRYQSATHELVRAAVIGTPNKYQWLLKALSGGTQYYSSVQIDMATVTANRTPDDAVWGPWDAWSGATGTIAFSYALSTAQQVIEAVNAAAAAASLVTASASGTVTGAIAEVSATALTGGVEGTPGPAGHMVRVDGSGTYTVYLCDRSTPPRWHSLYTV